jgi:hypothetical protein
MKSASLKLNRACSTQTKPGTAPKLTSSPVTQRNAVAEVSGFVLVRTSTGRRQAGAISQQETASALVKKVGSALSKPGIERAAVFPHGTQGSVVAYSADPNNPGDLIQESADGKKRVGRIVNGRFVPRKAA